MFYFEVSTLILALKNPEYNKLNLFHVAKLLNTFLNLETKFSINLLLELNMLNLLTDFIYNPLILDIFLHLISPTASRIQIEPPQQAEIWKYCYKHDVLLDLACQMLRGGETNKINYSKIDIQTYKFPENYEKNQKKVLSNEEIEQIDFDRVFGKFSVICDRPVII